MDRAGRLQCVRRQKQRLTIARALLRKPKVLILDDSTSAVDTATDAKIRKAFREEIPGTTKIIIAQRISSVQDADRILVLENGQINGLGTHAELLATNAIYQESTTARRRAAAILTSREVRSNGSKRSTWPRPAGRTGAAPQGGKPGQAAEAHHG